MTATPVTGARGTGTRVSGVGGTGAPVSGARGTGTRVSGAPVTDAPPVAPASLRPVADGVYAFVQPDGGWCLNNAGLVVGEERSVLVDTAATQARTRRLRAEVERLVPDGPDYVVNTHFHGDHTFGNGQFAPRSVIVAHEGCRADTAEAGLGLRHLWPDVEWGETPLTLPSLTFRDTLTVHAGNLRIELLHVGPAHTANDVVVWVPERSVLFTGDVVWSGVTPYVLMGSISGSLRALDRLRALGAETVVPGHGPVGGAELLDATEAYLRWVRELAENGVRRRLSPLRAAEEADLGAFARLVDSERLVGNLHRAYAELEGLAPGARIDVLASFKEMVAYHGGLPACHA
ncbi:MBL fold metallo-hydrolase [Streptomyces ficellus]|uniref:MBL fold metallo-hydrolase n=1 Tax=Streptomyces ficellus TaxID=1977088 RepID=A0ABT7Z7H8_9ACTN|nr:MBL fold metallo-hydrolase [Streptomyces ficellus]MDN3295403.1 MBL fold metallo-hydrolase [Streptomyces ficellus]